MPQHGAILMGIFAAMFAASCSRPASPAGDGGVGASLPAPRVDLPAPATGGRAEAVFAGGCFWCVEGVFEQLAGVLDVESGYAGGALANPSYEAVCSGTTGHAEVVRITYDPARVTYGQLLRIFFATHDPTTPNRQGPDAGEQYRSAIFYASEDQKKVAQAYIQQLDESGKFGARIVTRLEPLKAYYPAEKYHQDFVKRNPEHPYIQAWALPKIDKLRQKFPDAVQGGGGEPGAK